MGYQPEEGLGLSPRVRGNHPQYQSCARSRRSIPACTGKPPVATLPPSRARVYPRVYGETADLDLAMAAEFGLSPRVRGNQPPLRRGFRVFRSIPACTGKPRLRRFPRGQAGVYPRVYGETTDIDVDNRKRQGLSPRVRGNRHLQEPYAIYRRSIPACTGKPPTRSCGTAPGQVYPRVYGETTGHWPVCLFWYGLSPRVRGNHA